MSKMLYNILKSLKWGRKMGSQYDPSEYPLLLKEFAGYKLVIQACSPRTVNEYMLDLKTFFKYIISIREKIKFGTPQYDEISIKKVDFDLISSVTTSDIYDFLLFCEREFKNAPAARARKLSAIKGFFKYLVTKRGLLEINPSANIETPKKRKSLPKHLTLDEAILLLNTVARDSECRPEMRLRNYTMITLFLNCGIRRSELVGLNLSDVYEDRIRVVGKGNKERFVYFGTPCRKAIDAYLPERNKKVLSDNRALFGSRDNNRISVSAVHRLIKKYLLMAGLDADNFSAHKLRHTAATMMLSGGVDVKTVQEVLVVYEPSTELE